jgi:hypothetical protein
VAPDDDGPHSRSATILCSIAGSMVPTQQRHIPHGTRFKKASQPNLIRPAFLIHAGLEFLAFQGLERMPIDVGILKTWRFGCVVAIGDVPWAW